MVDAYASVLCHADVTLLDAERLPWPAVLKREGAVCLIPCHAFDRIEDGLGDARSSDAIKPVIQGRMR